jgi:signal transduction histidine kinase
LYGYTSEEALGRVSHELLRTKFPEALDRITGRLNRDRRWTGELETPGLYGPRGVKGFAERSKIAANLQLPVDLGRLPKDQEMCLFRLVQECLTNIHRHSGSSTALVGLWRAPGEIRMEVSDEGRGIHQKIQSKIASGKSAGVGLRRMRERVKQFDGTLEINSNGKGASILVTLPLSEEAVPPHESNAHSAEDQHRRSEAV